MNENIAVTAMLLAGLLLRSPLQAAENTTFHGSLIEPPPCSINDGKAIDVDFGERLGINRIDGNNYRQTVNYHISCEADAGAWEMTLTVSGQPAAFDKAAVQTDIKHLGIRLLQDGQPFTLDKPIHVDPKRLPVLEVVPVQQSGDWELSEGVFEATATLQANYL